MAEQKKKMLSNIRLFQFFEQLGTLISAGTRIDAALDIMKDDADNAALKPLIEDIMQQVRGGRHLTEAVKDTGVFPDYAVQLLAIGEETGKLEEVCGALARYYEEEDDLRQSIRSAVSYPIIMIVMMFAVVAVLVYKVLPIFAQVFDQLGTGMNAFSESLLNFGTQMNRSSTVIIVILALLTLFLPDHRKH